MTALVDRACLASRACFGMTLSSPRRPRGAFKLAFAGTSGRTLLRTTGPSWLRAGVAWSAGQQQELNGRALDPRRFLPLGPSGARHRSTAPIDVGSSLRPPPTAGYRVYDSMDALTAIVFPVSSGSSKPASRGEGGCCGGPWDLVIREFGGAHF